MSRLHYIAAGTLCLGLLAVVLITYTVGPSEIALLFRQANPFFLFGYIAVSLLIAMVLTFKWKLILHAKKTEVPFWKLFSYRLVGYSVSYLTPTAHVGGEPVRAFLLKREGVDINSAFSSVVIDKSIELIADVVFFFLGAILIINSVSVAGSMKIFVLMLSLIFILLMGMFIGGVLGRQSMFIGVFRFLRLHKIKRLEPIERNLAQVEKEVEVFYREERRYFWLIIMLIFALWALMFLEYKFALLIFGHLATPMQIFLILTGVGLAYSIPIPAAMGILELGQISAAKVLDLGSATGVALAFLVRARDLAWTAIGLIFLVIYEFNFSKLLRKTKEIDKNFEKGDLFKI
jgi:glycosyltransferase 2 family protein